MGGGDSAPACPAAVGDDSIDHVVAGRLIENGRWLAVALDLHSRNSMRMGDAKILDDAKQQCAAAIAKSAPGGFERLVARGGAIHRHADFQPRVGSPGAVSF